MRNPCDISWLQRKSWPKSPTLGHTLRAVDLFCGCGGISLGAIEAARVAGKGMRIALALDFDDEALAIYRDNLNAYCSAVVHSDVAAFFGGRIGAPLSEAEEKIRDQLGKIDLLVAGPPCQGNSDLNNSSRREDPRNSLYFRVVRAAEVLSARCVVIENVPAVVHDKGNVVERSRGALKRLNYQVSTATINATKVGLAQSRKRHFLVAVRGNPFEFGNLGLRSGDQAATLRDYIGDLNDIATNGHEFDRSSEMRAPNRERARYMIRQGVYDLPNALRPKCHQNDHHSYRSMYGRLRWDRPAQTITSGFGSMGQGRYLHPEHPRTLTPHEAARIQGFPDFFSFMAVTGRTKLQEVIGNAVPPRLTASIVTELIASGNL